MKGFTFDISDSMKPCIHACTGRCNIEYCSLCDRSHCIRDYCLSSEDTEPAEDKTLDSNVPEGLIPLPEPKRAASNERSSREGTRSSYEEQARHSPPTTIESEEESRLSDTEIDPAIRRWSPTDIALPSSKSSSSSTESPRSPDAKDRISTTACPAETEPQEAPDLGKKVSEVYDEKRPRLQTEQEQSRHLGSAVEIRQLEAREKEAKEERWRESESAPYKSHVSNDSIASSGQGHPSPYVPMAPFGGPGGRRRPRRPHLRQRGD
ncbi:hypothetical protein F4782DRAFT_345160 [Xylaria castorea]|nr:hypothetical protein F4782DRAFT_345160 [Xylaria castorea]